MVARPDISILCPTRGRPQNMTRLVNSAGDLSSRRIQFVFYMDSDDYDATIRQAEPFNFKNLCYEFIVGPRILLSEMWNRCAEKATADIMMHCGDDIVFRTPEWDWQVIKKFREIPDHIGLVHGRDGIHDGNLATHGFIHRSWVDAVGYFVPPYFASDYNDLWLTEVADAIGRRFYLPDLYTEHMHFAVGKAILDRTHAERLERHSNENCDRIWIETASKRMEDVKKLQLAIQKAASWVD